MKINWRLQYCRLCKPEDDTGGGGGGDGVIVLGRGDAPQIADSGGKPADPAGKPADPAGKPADPAGKPADPAGKPADPAHQWTVDSLLDAIGMKDLKPDDPRLKQWGDVKGMVKKAVEVNQSQSTQLAALEQSIAESKATEQALKNELAEAKKGVKTGDSTPAEVATIQAELATLKAERQKEQAELAEFKAKSNLAENPAFKQKYDGARAELVGAARETAKEIGLDEAKLDVVFSGESEFKVRKAVDELELTDPVAEKILIEKALEYSRLTREKETLLAGKAGRPASEVAAEWEAYNAQLGGALASRFTTKLQGEFLQALDPVRDEIAKESPFFKSETGAMVFDELRQRFSEGFDIPPTEAITALAWATAGPVYEKQAIELAAQVRTLQAQITTLTGQAPSKAATTPGGGSVAKPSGGTGRVEYDPFRRDDGGTIVLEKPARVA